jgi:ribonuclease HI
MYTKELVKKHHDKTMPTHDADTTLCIYTDGSRINNHIGAAAYCPTIATTKHQHLGKESTHNVYAAELSAIYFATTIVKDNSQYTECVIYSDSQAAISFFVLLTFGWHEISPTGIPKESHNLKSKYGSLI